MRKTFIIARREYLERVRSKSFLFMTLFIPALLLGTTVLPSVLMTRGTGGTKHLIVVASDETSGNLIREQLIQLNGREKKQSAELQPAPRRQMPQIGTLIVDVDTDTSDSHRADLTDKVKLKQLDGVLFATREALAAKKVAFVTEDVSSFVANEEIERAVTEAVRRDLLKSKGMTDQEIDVALRQVDVNPESPTRVGNPQVLFITVLALVMILYVTVLLYGVNVMRAILEEKTSRVMEVMLSTARSSEMMAGKIIGVAAVGLTQIGIWAAFVVLAAAGGTLAILGSAKNILSPGLLAYFGLFFLLGFVLYSTLCAAVGAMVNSEQEAQQMQFVVMVPLIAAMVILLNVFQYPSSPTAFWASLFPLTAPMIMFLRVALQSPPWWQIVLSIGLMIATIGGLIWVCGRIYRVGILMYGKKPTLPEIMKWIRYA
jgi:ABC-2 type transport system permease protein